MIAEVPVPDSVTVNRALTVPLLPSVTDTSPIDSEPTGAVSSLVIVPWPCPSAIVAPGGAREVHEERLGRLDGGVAVDGHVHELLRRPGGEGQRARLGRVVAAGAGRAVGGRVGDRDGGGAGRRKRDREPRVHRPAVAFRHRDVADGQRRQGRRVVVGDRPQALAVGDRRARGAGQVHEEGLGRLDGGVAVDRSRPRTAASSRRRRSACPTWPRSRCRRRPCRRRSRRRP